MFLREGFPVNVLNQVKLVPEVCRIYCATANPVQVIVAETAAGRGILGVIDGAPPLGVETEADVAERAAAAAADRLQALILRNAGGRSAPGAPRPRR